MYKYLLLCLFLSAVISAPQDSNITFLEIQPLIDDNLPENISLEKSEVDNLPIAIANISDSEFVNNRSEELTTEFEEPQTTVTPETTTRKLTTQYTYKPKSTPKTFSKPRPRVTSNLGYISKPKYVSSMNLIEKNDKKKFKSHCRCEKIWNCPKLQITIPRCPNEYFLCCF